MKKILLLIAIFGILFLPLTSLAGTYQADGIEVTYEGLVPCGKCATTSIPLSGQEIKDLARETECQKAGYFWYANKCHYCPSSQALIPCQFCHLFVMIDAVIDFVLFKLVLPIATLMIVIAGILYVGAIFEFLPGGFKTLSQAKEVLAGVVIGLFIIFSAWLILYAFFDLIGISEFYPELKEGWFEITCPIKL